MSAATFPVLTSGRKADAAGFAIQLEDPAIKSDMEGGYVVSRARHTRTPRQTFALKYTDLSDADKATLLAFWTTVRGSSVIFDWTNPDNAVVYAVRFKDPLAFQYAGYGNLRRWDCSFSVEQA